MLDPKTSSPQSGPAGYSYAAAMLEELLGEDLNADSVIESERLSSVLRMRQLPAWPVSSSSLPKDVPAGPRGGGDIDPWML